MSFKYTQESKISNISISKPDNEPKKQKDHEHEVEIKVENFISSIFQSVKENIQNEKDIVSKFVSSLFEEAENEIIVSKFVDFVFTNSKKDVMRVKNQFNITRHMLDSQKDKSICSVQNDINEKTSNSTKTNEPMNSNSCVEYDGNNSISKYNSVYTEVIPMSNVKTFYKENRKGNRLTSKSSLKKKRNCSSIKRDINDNSKFNSNSHKSHLSVQFRTKVDKEMKKCEEKVKIMKKRIAVMKIRQEEIGKKISSLKHREENIQHIKKEKAILKEALIYNTEKKKTELNKIRRDIEKRKEEINNGLKQSSGKAKLEKMKNYKKVKEEKKELDDKIESNRQKNNSNVKCLIKKIRVLRAFNKNIIPKKKKVIFKNNDEINTKICQKNMEITNYLKNQIKELQNQEYEYMNKLNKTKEKLSNYDIEGNSFSTIIKTFKKTKSHVINC